MIRTSLLESTTYTVASNAAGVDISGIDTTKGESCVVLEILNLVGKVRVSVQASDDSFSSIADEIAFSVEGPVGNTAPLRYSVILPREHPSYPLGVANMSARVSLSRISGAGATITLRSWIEHA